jgi:hypothetical protein
LSAGATAFQSSTQGFGSAADASAVATADAAAEPTATDTTSTPPRSVSVGTTFSPEIGTRGCGS